MDPSNLVNARLTLTCRGPEETGKTLEIEGRDALKILELDGLLIVKIPKGYPVADVYRTWQRLGLSERTVFMPEGFEIERADLTVMPMEPIERVDIDIALKL